MNTNVLKAANKVLFWMMVPCFAGLCVVGYAAWQQARILAVEFHCALEECELEE